MKDDFALGILAVLSVFLMVIAVALGTEFVLPPHL